LVCPLISCLLSVLRFLVLCFSIDILFMLVHSGMD
jgi:hypothetical protein